MLQCRRTMTSSSKISIDTCNRNKASVHCGQACDQQKHGSAATVQSFGANHDEPVQAL